MECGLVVDYCDVFISCLDSFWRHPFTAEDPLKSKWCDAKFLQIGSDEETNSSTSYLAWGWLHFQQIFIFGWTIPLMSQHTMGILNNCIVEYLTVVGAEQVL